MHYLSQQVLLMFAIHLIILHFRIWIQEIILGFEAVWHTERSVGAAPTNNNPLWTLIFPFELRNPNKSL